MSAPPNFASPQGQFGLAMGGMSGLLPFTGNVIYVSESTGSDGNTGGMYDPLATLTQGLSQCTSGNNDIIFMTGTVHTAATIAWSKSKTHLIGLAPALGSQARARISSTGTVFTPLVNVTGSECIFMNIGAFHGFADASTQICWVDSGGRNQYQNCNFLGMGNATAAAQAGSRSLVITGPNGENTFNQCVIGLDTVVRATNANASLEFTAATPRNVFRDCIFAIDTSLATNVHITVGSGGMDRYAYFDRCLFMNAVESGSTTMNAAITANASAGGAVILQSPISLGATAIATTGPVYIIGGVPVATTSGIAIKAT